MSVKAKLFTLFTAFALTLSLSTSASAISNVAAPGATYLENMCSKLMMRHAGLIPGDVLSAFETAFAQHILPATVGSMHLEVSGAENVTTSEINALTSMLDIGEKTKWALDASFSRGDLTSIILGRKVKAFEVAVESGVSPVAVALLFARLELNLAEYTIRKGLGNFASVYNKILPPETKTVEVTEDLFPSNVMGGMYPSNMDMGPSGNFFLGSQTITRTKTEVIGRTIELPAADYFLASVAVLKTFLKTTSPETLETASGGAVGATDFKVLSTLFREEQLQELARRYYSMTPDELNSYAEFFTPTEMGSMENMAGMIARGEKLPAVFDVNNNLHRILQANYPLIKKLFNKTQTALAYTLSMVPETEAAALNAAMVEARVVLRQLVQLYGLNLKNVGITDPIVWWERLGLLVAQQGSVTPIHPQPTAIPVLRSTTGY